MLSPLKCAILESALAVVLMSVSGPVSAQLAGEPSEYQIPDFTAPDSGRAVVIKVMFNTATDVTVVETLVSNRSAPGAEANPPLIRLERMQPDGNLIGEDFAWHPLMTREWDLDGTETGLIESSGEGLFLVPFDVTLDTVRISDVQRDLTLVDVDVSAEVIAYCDSNPGVGVCILFNDGFE